MSHASEDYSTSPPLTSEAVSELIKRSYLNFSDLKNCRLVSREWNSIISASDSLRQGILYVSLEHQNRSTIESTLVQWKHIRFYLFEFGNLNDQPTMTIPFYSSVQTVEFKQCFITWHMFKRCVINMPLLQNLIFHRCIFRGYRDPNDRVLSSTDHDQFLMRMNSTNAVTVSDVMGVSGVVEILQNLLVYATSNLETLKIEYNPSAVQIMNSDAIHFLQVLTELILLNKTTLKNLILNIRCSDILNHFESIVFSRLENFYTVLQLRVFKLAQPMSDPTANVAITTESTRFLRRLIDFLRSQHQLKSLAFPFIQNLDKFEAHRGFILDQTTKFLHKLRVPGAMYMRRNSFRAFQNLKCLFIGEAHSGPSTYLHPIKFNVDRVGIVRRHCTHTTHISVCAKIIYETGNLYHLLEKFPNLTKFEFNAFRPLFNDKDIQAIIKYAPALTHLSITHCDFITDFGVTGIPLDTCQEMLRYSTVYIDNIMLTKTLVMNGVPLSELKNLVSLLLIGSANITDVGVKFGLKFGDLRRIQLPYGKWISEWGIEELGLQNPCLESITLTGVTDGMVIGLTTVFTKHKRVVKKLCKIQNINEIEGDLLHPTLLHAILWNTS